VDRERLFAFFYLLTGCPQPTMTGGPARMISGFGDGDDDGDGVDWRARISSMTGGKWKLIVDVGADDDFDFESRAFRMSSMTGGKSKLIVGIGAGDDADFESRAFRMPPRGPMTLTGVGDGDDDSWRAIRMGSAT
jgi:hypothetical protein